MFVGVERTRTMADLDVMIAQLRELNQPVPKPMRLPTAQEVDAIAATSGLSFPPEFRRYLLEASDVVFGALEPVTVTNLGDPTHFPEVLADARRWGVPADLIPICEDNSDFYCITPSGAIVFWSHNGTTDERWPCIAAWIEEVWIGESD